MRTWLTNLLVVLGAVSLVAAVFLPVICVFFMVGLAFMGDCVSLWEISPLLGSLIILCVVAPTGTALWRPGEHLPSALFTAGLCLAVVSAAGVTVLLLSIMFIHYFALGAVILAMLLYVAAAFIARRPGQRLRFRFHLRTLLLCITVAGIALATLRAAFR